MTKNLLIITTNFSGKYCEQEDSHCIKETGVYLEEFAVPYLIFEKSNINMEVVSLEGGLSPIDKNSISCSSPDDWDKCIKILRNTRRIYDIDYKMYGGVYFPGGHGPLFDIANSNLITEIVEYFYNSGKLVSAICHGVVALINAKTTCGNPIVHNKRVTSFTNKEEDIAKMSEMVPLSIENELKNRGADYIEFKPWAEHVEVDENIITGQNQNSATLIAEKILEFFAE